MKSSTRLLLFGGMLVSLASPALLARFEWKPVSPEERAETHGQVEPDAAAELLFWEIEESDERTTEYTRYKIYEPEKTADLTRITYSDSMLADVEVRARLVLPDGTEREFGEDDARTREQTKGSSAKERLLAVPGVVPNSIVEFWREIDRGQPGPGPEGLHNVILQRENVPVRQVRACFHFPNERMYDFQVFVINAPDAKLEKDAREKTITVTASRLPALLTEPFLGAQTDYAATVLAVTTRRTLQIGAGAPGENVSTKIDPDAGPWAAFATAAYIQRKALAAPTKRVIELAAKLCEGAPNELEKARRIHRYVQTLYRAFSAKPMDMQRVRVVNATRERTLDEVLDFATGYQGHRIMDSDFVWLAAGLYEAAGLETSTVLLPDRRQTRFNPDFVSMYFLPGMAIRVKVDGEWRFSYPTSAPPPGRGFIWLETGWFAHFIGTIPVVPFGMLPWNYEGQKALVAQAGKQEFIDVPPSAASDSLIALMGAFQLDASGALTGRARRRLTGHVAMSARGSLASVPEADRDRIARVRLLEGQFPGAEVNVEGITGIEDPEQPLEITFSLTWPSYAVVTRDRIVFQPDVFHAGDKPLFPSPTRRHPVSFLWRRQEVMRMGIQLPPGFAPESLEAPQSFPGKALGYEIKYSYDAKRRLVVVNRDLSSDVIDIPASAYPTLKAWYDAVHVSDTHELVFVRSESAPGNTTPPASERAEQ